MLRIQPLPALARREDRDAIDRFGSVLDVDMKLHNMLILLILIG